MRLKKHDRMNEKQVKLVKALAKGKKKEDALRLAGYSTHNGTAITQVQKKPQFITLLERYGPKLTDAFNVTKEAMKATSKKPQMVGRDDNGKPVYEYIDEEDHPTRLKAAEQVYRIHGVLQSDGASNIHNGDNNQFNIYIEPGTPLAATIRELRPGDMERSEAIQDDQSASEGA